MGGSNWDDSYFYLNGFKSLVLRCLTELFTLGAFDFRQHHAAIFALQP